MICHQLLTALLPDGEVAYFQEGQVLPEEKVGLTEEGKRQARAVAQFLKDVPMDGALHTGLPRTRETAEIILSTSI